MYLYCVLIKINLLDIYNFKEKYNNILKKFINIIKIRFGYIIKFIKINNKQSFKRRYQNFLVVIGITLERIAPYLPQQNSSTEYFRGILIIKT